MDTIVIQFKKVSEIEDMKSSKSSFRWGVQTGQAKVFDEAGAISEIRKVNVNIPYNEKTGTYEQWEEGFYSPPHGSQINGYGGISSPMMQALIPTQEKK